MDGTPSGRIVLDSNSNATVVDARGRVITVRFPTSFLRMRLARFIGQELQKNEEWWGNAIVALAVTAIDDVPMPEARNVDQVEGVIYRLDDDGMIAVAQWLKAQAEKRAETLIDIAKN